MSFRCYDISDVIPTDHNKFSSVSNTIVVAIFPIFFFFTRHSLCSNLGGIDHEKPSRATSYRVSLAAVFSVITHTKNSCDYHVSRLLHSRFLCLHATLLPTNWGKICIFLKPPYSSVFDHVGVQSVFKDRCKEFI